MCFFLVYSTSNQENTVNQLLYPGFVEEIVDAIRLNDTNPRYAVCFVLVSLLKHPNSFSHVQFNLERNQQYVKLIEPVENIIQTSDLLLSCASCKEKYYFFIGHQLSFFENVDSHYTFGEELKVVLIVCH